MPKADTSTKSKLELILDNMDYNEEQKEDSMSSILNWISERNGRIESIVDGSPVSGANTTSKDEFCIGDHSVSVCYLDETAMKLHLERERTSDDKKPTGRLDENERRERITKFKKLVADLKNDLCAVENVATRTPVWQVKEFDAPAWEQQIGSKFSLVSHDELASEESGKRNIIVFIQLSREGYSMEKILPIFSTLLESDEKFILVSNSRSAPDSPTLLPLAFLVNALNAAKIRKWPIDLLLLDRSLEKPIISFLQAKTVSSKSKSMGQVYLWGLGAQSTFNNNFPSLLSSGVVCGGGGGSRAHFIFDSLADVQTAVDSIVAEVWSSGVQVNQRTRSVAFVHQPIYKLVVELLEKKLAALKTSTDLSLKSNEFVRRSEFADAKFVEVVRKIRDEGAKIFPPGSDFSMPTLLSELGTSCDIMASSTSGLLGHVLCVISYRSNAELLTLANNYGENNSVFIHSQNWANIREIATSIKATSIWVNSNRRVDLLEAPAASNQLLSKLWTSEPPQTQQDEPTKAQIDKFVGAVLGAEKAAKLWSSYGVEKRHSAVAEAFLQRFSGQDTDRFHFLSELMRVAGRMFNEDSPSLKLRQYSPAGVSAIAFTNPESGSFTSEEILLPILLALLKGNSVLVVATSDSISAAVSSIATAFPPGCVQFIQSLSSTHALRLISHPGKVALLWIIHSGRDCDSGITHAQIPYTSFNRVIVSHAGSIRKSGNMSKLAAQLELAKIIFL